MSIQDSGQLNQGAELAKKEMQAGASGLKTVGKTGVRAGKSLFTKGTKEAAKGAAKGGAAIFSNPYVLAAVAILVAILFLAILASQGTISSTEKRVVRQTATGEDTNYNDPKTDEEEHESIHDKSVPIEDTISLAKIIHEARAKDYAQVRGIAENSLKSETWEANGGTATSSIDASLSLQKAKIDFTEASHWIYEGSELSTSSGGFVGGTIIDPNTFYSEKVIRAEAASGESGLEGQKAGDQRGNEVRMSNGYGKSWDYVIRAKEDAVKLRIADAAIKGSKNNYIGYDQDMPDRKSAYKEAKKVNFDLSAVKTNCETTCGEFANVCIAAAGISEYYAPGEKYVATDNLWDNLKSSGKFEKIKVSSSNALPGDILINAGTHTAIVVKSPNRITGAAVATTGTSLQPQKYRTTLQTIRAKSKINLSSIRYTAQSFVYAEGKFYVQRISPGKYGSGGKLEVYDKNGNLQSTGPYLTCIGHGNGLGYKDGKIYSTYAGSGGTNRHAYVINPSTLDYERTINLANAASGIGYDTSSGKWAINQRNYICIYTGDLNKREKRFTKEGSHSSDLVQDCMAAGGVVYAIIHNGGKNYIDLYSESNGDYLGSYVAEGDELEGITTTEDGEIALLYHGPSEYIVLTGIKVAESAQSSGPEYVSAYDMDILGAYNVSLSNSAMYLDYDAEKAPKSNFMKWLTGNAEYTDASGKRLTIYWAGDKRGLINYEKDLSKKVNNWLGEGDVRISEDASEYDSSFNKDAWNLLLVNGDNAIPSGFNPSLSKLKAKYISSGDVNDKDRNRVDSRITEELEKMMDDCTEACKSTGHVPLVISAYRSRETQEDLYDGGKNAEDTAAPGHSEHEAGLAVDIIDSTSLGWSDPLVPEQANTSVQKWLMDNCQNYGFILRYSEDKRDITKIIWEPWHYRYVGKEHAKKIMSNKICLEEYHQGNGNFRDLTDGGNSKHFFKFAIGNKSIKEGDTFYKPITIKETEVDELMKPLFGIHPTKTYVNSLKPKEAKMKSGKESEEEKTRKSYLVNTGKDLSTTNINAAYSLSDNTGRLVFGDLTYMEDVDFNLNQGFSLGSFLSPGALKLPIEPGKFTVSSHFTNGKLRQDVKTGRPHDGVDFAAPTGTPVYASLPGKITFAGVNGGYGNCIKFTTMDGGTELLYGHLDKILCSEGDLVTAGTLIGKVGSTGFSTGSHLHFEVRIGSELKDPEPLLGLKS